MKRNMQNDHINLRKMMADAGQGAYRALKSLEEARHTANSYLVLEGDDGGQVYIVAPVDLVRCNETELQQLLSDLDKKSWDDISMAALRYEVHQPGSVISGGMGGGRAEKSLWVHEDFSEIKEKIGKVLDGSSAHL